MSLGVSCIQNVSCTLSNDKSPTIVYNKLNEPIPKGRIQ